MQIYDVQPQLYIIKKAERQAERTSYFIHILFTIEHKNIQNISTEKMHQFEKKKCHFEFYGVAHFYKQESVWRS